MLSGLLYGPTVHLLEFLRVTYTLYFHTAVSHVFPQENATQVSKAASLLSDALMAGIKSNAIHSHPVFGMFNNS